MFRWLKLRRLCRRLSSFDSTDREAAAEALGALGDARAVAPLIKALADEAGQVRAAAGRALELLGEAKWKVLLQGDMDDFVRLASSGDPRLVEPMVKALGNKEVRVATNAAFALGELGDARAVGPLAEALSKGNASLRCGAAYALGELDDRRAVEPLIHALEGRERRVSDLRSLCGGIGNGDLLARGLKSEIAACQQIAESLGKLGDPRAVEPLIKTLGDRRPRVCGAVASALGQLGDQRGMAPLIGLLGDRNGGIRRVAAEALESLGEAKWKALVQGDIGDFSRLGSSGDPRAVEPLIRSLVDADASVRRAAAEGLESLGEAKWKALVQGDRGDLSRLGSSGDPGAIELLAGVLDGAERLDFGGTVGACVEALAEAGGTHAVGSLIKALWNEDAQIRKIAAEAWGRSGDSRAVEPLIKALGDLPQWATADESEMMGDKNYDVRRAAAQALGNLGDPSAVGPLIKALERDVPTDVVACALGRLGDLRAVEPLIKVMQVSCGHWRDAAVVALGCLGDLRAIEPLVEALGHKDPRLYRYAAAALRGLLTGPLAPTISLSRWQLIRERIAESSCHEHSVDGFTGEDRGYTVIKGIGLELPPEPPPDPARKGTGEEEVLPRSAG